MKTCKKVSVLLAASAMAAVVATSSPVSAAWKWSDWVGPWQSDWIQNGALEAEIGNRLYYVYLGRINLATTWGLLEVVCYQADGSLEEFPQGPEAITNVNDGLEGTMVSICLDDADQLGSVFAARGAINSQPF